MDFSQHNYTIFLFKDVRISSVQHAVIYSLILYDWHFAPFNMFYFLVLLHSSVGIVSMQSQGDKFL